MTQKPLIFAVLSATAVALAGCPESPAPTTNSAAPVGTQATAPASASAVAARPLPPMPKAPALAATPEGLGELKVPADNALTPEKVALGKQLFFDKRLSKDGSASCETCHVPEKGWTDGAAFSGVSGLSAGTLSSGSGWGVGARGAAWGMGGSCTSAVAVAVVAGFAVWRGFWGWSLDSSQAARAKDAKHTRRGTSGRTGIVPLFLPRS
jgi:hypothetical protein